MPAEPLWDFDLGGMKIKVKEGGKGTALRDGKEVVIKNQLAEVFEGNGQRQVFALAEDTETAEPYFAKIRYQLNPKYFDFDDPEEEMQVAEKCFSYEVDAADILDKTGYGPRCISHWKARQSVRMPYHGGTVYYLTMSAVPGKDADEIYDELSETQLASIKRQLASILELSQSFSPSGSYS